MKEKGVGRIKKIAERKVERRNLPKAWEEREANRNVEQSDVVG